MAFRISPHRMTTALLKAVVTAKLSENEAIDLLQEAGVVSDLCVRLRDVADDDCKKAVNFLTFYTRHRPKMKGAK